jgi:hypothetical protein
MSGPGSLHSIRDHNREIDGQLQPVRSHTPSDEQGTTKLIRPGDPHYHGTTIHREEGTATNFLCRCNKPTSHKDAWAATDRNPYAIDSRGIPITWKQTANRVLDHCGKIEVSREEEHRAYRHVLSDRSYQRLKNHYYELNEGIAMGAEVIISPYQGNVVHHNGDGHAQNHITEGGLRTMYNTPGREGWRPANGYWR